MKVFILRGVPGAGKSTLTDSLRGKGSSVVCEADDFFVQGGVYKFDPTLLQQAHSYCYGKFLNAVAQNVDTIIVSNTFTQKWEFQKYLDFAKAQGIHTTVLVVENYHGGKNTHGVPEEKVQQMADRFTIQLKS